MEQEKLVEVEEEEKLEEVVKVEEEKKEGEEMVYFFSWQVASQFIEEMEMEEETRGRCVLMCKVGAWRTKMGRKVKYIQLHFCSALPRECPEDE